MKVHLILLAPLILFSSSIFADIGSESNSELNEIENYLISVTELKACSYNSDSADKVFPHNSKVSIGNTIIKNDKETQISISGENYDITERSIMTLGFQVGHGNIKKTQGVIHLTNFNRLSNNIIVHEGSANLKLGNIDMKISAYSDRGLLGIADGKIIELIRTELDCKKD